MGDGPRLRALRLQALRSHGTAFLETLCEAEALDAAAWEARIARCSRRGHQVLVVAEGSGSRSWVGMAGAFLDSERGTATEWAALAGNDHHGYAAALAR
ncbi:hypothetical protein [Nocardia sp. NPDC057440]|uniref:hypothetical protein n=1 Tax=Nocardia sp. NPDC057440 TaxID=3346134 RepID=UPI00367064DA